MRPVDAADALRIADPQLRSYVQRFCATAHELQRTMESYGVPLESEAEAAARRERMAELERELEAAGAEVLNDGKSVAFGERSPACVRCRTGVRSVSSFISLACGRGCWFCFNPNQCDWERYRDERKDWESELRGWKDALGGLDFVALTGGEPLRFPDEACRFIDKAKRLSEGGHVRLYTSGPGLDARLIERLAAAGLDEVRFSVKLDEGSAARVAVMESLRACVGRIPCVMVEMPVVPGTREPMERLIEELDAAGAFGVNLLELCFPLHNAAAFRERDLTLVRDPYRIPYAYGYAGALPVAGSEELALQLMRDAIARGTELSLHYCSLENKNTAQIYAQDHGGSLDIPPYRFSERSFFYETVRAFGDDAARAEALLQGSGFAFDAAGEGAARMIAFDPAALPHLGADALAEARLFLASAVFEDEGGGERFREVGLQVLEPQDAEGLAR